jgi:DNA end-binding protein Ku
MKAIWKGKLSFGLVTIDIELYSAIQAHSFGFKLLHDKCLTPIHYKRWCPHCNQEVEWNHVVKGLPLKNGSYFVLTQANLKKLKPEKSSVLEIVEVVDQQAIEPIYYDNHYYLSPGRNENKAYYLFIAALADLKKTAIGQFILKEKQYVCAITPYHNGLLLSTLNYAYEIRSFKEIEETRAPVKIDQKELKLAELLISKLYTKKFDMKKYKDIFFEELKKRVEAAVKGIKLPKEAKKPKGKKELSLEQALKASLKKVPVQPTVTGQESRGAR